MAGKDLVSQEEKTTRDKAHGEALGVLMKLFRVAGMQRWRDGIWK